MEFKTWLLEENTLTIPINRLWGWNEKVAKVIQNVNSGKLSHSTGPLIVSQLDNPRSNYFVMDGHHRVVEAIMNGKSTIQANIDEFVPRIERTGGAFSNILNNKVRIINALQE